MPDSLLSKLLDVRRVIEERKAQRCRKHKMKRSPWSNGGQWQFLRQFPKKNLGEFGELMAHVVFSHKGMDIGDPTSVDFDWRVEGPLEKLVGTHEIKLSVLNDDWHFKWLHVHLAHDYDLLTLIGVYPDDIRMWCLTRFAVNKLVEHRFIKPLRNKRVEADDNYMSLDSTRLPRWLNPYEVPLDLKEEVSCLDLPRLTRSLPLAFSGPCLAASSPASC